MESILKVDEIEKNIEKIKMFNNENQEYLNNFSNFFNNSLYYYKTNNSQGLSNLATDMNNNIKKIATNTANDLQVLEQTKAKYIETTRKTAQLFDNII